MAQFRVGQRAVIVKSPDPSRIGEVHRIVDLRPLRAKTGSFWPPALDGAPAAELDYASCFYGQLIAYPLCHLEPYRPDHNERADLSAMPEWIRRLTKQRERA